MSWGDPNFGSSIFRIAPPEPWTEDALCAQIGGDEWFPEIGDGAAAAKRICNMCPVKQKCLDYAIERRERYGVWGGMGERERRKIERGNYVGPQPLDPLKCGTSAQYKAHHRRGETPCEACKRANNLDYQERRRRRRAA